MKTRQRAKRCSPRPIPSRRSTTRPQVEWLEDRQVLSGNPFAGVSIVLSIPEHPHALRVEINGNAGLHLGHHNHPSGNAAVRFAAEGNGFFFQIRPMLVTSINANIRIGENGPGRPEVAGSLRAEAVLNPAPTAEPATGGRVGIGIVVTDPNPGSETQPGEQPPVPGGETGGGRGADQTIASNRLAALFVQDRFFTPFNLETQDRRDTPTDQETSTFSTVQDQEADVRSVEQRRTPIHLLSGGGGGEDEEREEKEQLDRSIDQTGVARMAADAPSLMELLGLPGDQAEVLPADGDPGEELAVPLLDSLSEMAEEVHDPEQRAEIALWLMAAAVAGVGVSTAGESLGTRRQRQPGLNRWPLQR